MPLPLVALAVAPIYAWTEFRPKSLYPKNILPTQLLHLLLFACNCGDVSEVNVSLPSENLMVKPKSFPSVFPMGNSLIDFTQIPCLVWQ